MAAHPGDSSRQALRLQRLVEEQQTKITACQTSLLLMGARSWASCQNTVRKGIKDLGLDGVTPNRWTETQCKEWLVEWKRRLEQGKADLERDLAQVQESQAGQQPAGEQQAQQAQHAGQEHAQAVAQQQQQQQQAQQWHQQQQDEDSESCGEEEDFEPAVPPVAAQTGQTRPRSHNQGSVTVRNDVGVAARYKNQGAGPPAAAFSISSGSNPASSHNQHPHAQQPPQPRAAAGLVAGASSSSSGGDGAACGSRDAPPVTHHHLNDELEKDIRQRLPDLQAEAIRLPLPLATPAIITRPPTAAVVAQGLAAQEGVAVAIDAALNALSTGDQQAMTAALQAAAAHVLVMNEFGDETKRAVQPALKTDPVKADPVIYEPYQVPVEQSVAAAKATVKESLACEEGGVYLVVYDSALPPDPRAGRSAVRDCARGGGTGPPERALLQPMNGSSFNGSPAIVFLPRGDAELHELPINCRAFKLSFDKAGWNSTQDDDTVDRLQFIGGTTSVRPVLNPDGGARGVGAARVAGGSLILVNPDGTKFECELGFHDIKGCLEAVIQAALAAPRMPIILNHKSALGFRFDLRRDGSWGKSGSAGAVASNRAQGVAVAKRELQEAAGPEYAGLLEEQHVLDYYNDMGPEDFDAEAASGRGDASAASEKGQAQTSKRAAQKKPEERTPAEAKAITDRQDAGKLGGAKCYQGKKLPTTTHPFNGVKPNGTNDDGTPRYQSNYHLPMRKFVTQAEYGADGGNTTLDNAVLAALHFDKLCDFHRTPTKKNIARIKEWSKTHPEWHQAWVAAGGEVE